MVIVVVRNPGDHAYVFEFDYNGAGGRDDANQNLLVAEIEEEGQIAELNDARLQEGLQQAVLIGANAAILQERFERVLEAQQRSAQLAMEHVVMLENHLVLESNRVFKKEHEAIKRNKKALNHAITLMHDLYE